MKLFGNLAVYLGIGFLMSFIISSVKTYLYVSFVMFLLGIALIVINNKRNR